MSYKPNLTPRLMSSILGDISSGRVLWGVLRANEYNTPEDPLRRAIVRIARRAAAEHLAPVLAPLFEAACAGQTLGMLPAAAARIIREEERGLTPPGRRVSFTKNRFRRVRLPGLIRRTTLHPRDRWPGTTLPNTPIFTSRRNSR